MLLKYQVLSVYMASQRTHQLYNSYDFQIKRLIGITQKKKKIGTVCFHGFK